MDIAAGKCKAVIKPAGLCFKQSIGNTKWCGTKVAGMYAVVTAFYRPLFTCFHVADKLVDNCPARHAHGAFDYCYIRFLRVYIHLLEL